jgi:hypothetical protein
MATSIVSLMISMFSIEHRRPNGLFSKVLPRAVLGISWHPT